MLNLGGLADLADALGVELGFLHEVLDDFDEAPARLVKEMTIWHPDKSKKPRDVICLRSRWRLVQDRIYRKLLLAWFKPLRCCHGGVRKRSPATNARMHLGNTHAFVTDIANFFPTIKSGRVNRFFLDKACTYQVARALTRLCTYNHHLALGLVTSPLIANEIMRPVDLKIGQFCQPKKIAHSRFIDDIALSAKFDLKRCRTRETIEAILARHNFKIAPKKTNYGRLDVLPVRERGDKERLEIAGVRINGYQLDPSKKFLEELDRIIADHQSLGEDGAFEGPFYLQGEVFGKAYHVCSLNPGRRRELLGRLKSIDWFKVMANALDRELCRFEKVMTSRGEPRPDCSVALPLAEGARNFKKYRETHPHDPMDVPFEAAAESSGVVEPEVS